MAEPFTIYKLIVLYMAEHSREELTNSQISEFVLDREYTDYFHLQQVLSELVETGLLKRRTVSNSSHYELTEEGSSTLSYFEKDLSPDIRKEIDDFLKDYGCRIPERIRMTADYFTTPQGTYAVRCQLIEKESTIMDVTLAAPNKEAARAICKNWPQKCQSIYTSLMGELI